MRDLIRRAGRALAPASLMPLLLLSGCHWAILDPQGSVGLQEKRLLIYTLVGLSVFVVAPVIIATIAFAWHFRASNTKAKYRPDFNHSNIVEFFSWGGPCVIVAILGVVTWISSHQLDPYKPLPAPAGVTPMDIDAISLDWKWLFIYPAQHIASVNELAMPVGTPVNFHITSATVMNAFFIPKLGTQIYAMGGMQTAVHLIADHAGTYRGLSSNFSGDGFSGMTFQAIATDQAGFKTWVQKVRQSSLVLNTQTYADLAKPTQDVKPTFYGSVQGDIFAQQIAAFMGPKMSMSETKTSSTHAASKSMSGTSGM
ncbi:MAG: ubiquinol oxidase subunit II [Proteobacteria bacterium]|nr:ubiquinol oxidase subunit II [Pseudomonadota bacterium]